MKSITKNLQDLLREDEFYISKNKMEAPRLKAVSLNVAIKAENADNKLFSYILSQLALLSGQKSVLTKSKKAISGFKVRKGMYVGSMVTLRGKKMFNFLDKLVNISLPRVKDFRGLPSNSFNQSNHYTFGLKDHSIFLEVDLDNIMKVFGINITIISTARTKSEALLLLKKINLPIR